MGPTQVTTKHDPPKDSGLTECYPAAIRELATFQFLLEVDFFLASCVSNSLRIAEAMRGQPKAFRSFSAGFNNYLMRMFRRICPSWLRKARRGASPSIC